MKSSIVTVHHESPAVMIAKSVLAEIMAFRRIPTSHKSCNNADCDRCSSWHLPKMVNRIELREPIQLVLPAFPGKSPNLEKVLGPLPDLAEQLSLIFLSHLCQKIKRLYSPGVHIILCSDGRVFSDVVGMKEHDVSDYQAGLKKMIRDLNIHEITIFDLDDHGDNLSFAQKRASLLDSYGASLEQLQQRIQAGAHQQASSDEQEANRMYRGITRFLYEDSLFQGQKKSNTTLQKEARIKAYEVIRRSNSWSELIAEKFQDAVRLSIHPQSCGSKKLGIRLIRDESWMTPWHGVAVETHEGYFLTKRASAEAAGAVLVHSADGRPSHYKLFSRPHTPAWSL